MRNRMLIGLLAAIAFGTVMGCSTLTLTPKENANMVKTSWRTDIKAIGDDWNMIWLTDHETHLTRWHTR